MAIFNNNTEEYIRKQVLEREKVYKAQKRTILVEGVGINDSDGMTSCWYVNLEGKKTKWFCPVYTEYGKVCSTGAITLRFSRRT